MKWLLPLVLLLSACVVTPTPSAAPSTNSPLPSSTVSPPTSASPSTCDPGDQVSHVYNPARLKVLAPCIRVTGTVAVIRIEADGDRHILVSLDPPFQYLLVPANNGQELGDLVVEPICVGTVTQSDAQAVCAADPDPLKVLPVIGQHVWLEGQLVSDTAHGGWTEIHPLARWAVSAAVSEGE